MGWGVLDDVFARRSLIQRIRRGSGWVGGWVGGGWRLEDVMVATVVAVWVA
jgi:hypothetical protein